MGYREKTCVFGQKNKNNADAEKKIHFSRFFKNDKRLPLPSLGIDYNYLKALHPQFEQNSQDGSKTKFYLKKW